MADPSAARANATDLAWAAAVALGLALGYHVAFARHGLNLSDEGFLLYGVQRVLEGAVPLRDFQAYEPARYSWCAAWCAVRGEGFLALREALALFLAVGLFGGLLVARRVFPSRWLALLVGVLLLAWSFPRYRVFESGLATIAVLVGVHLVENPTPRRHLLAGAFVGLAVLFGRNLGLYAVLGLGALALFLALRERRDVPRRLGAFALGGLIWSAPLLFMLVAVPGYAASLFESIRFFAEAGVNVPLPYPWPWRLGIEGLGTLERVAVGAAFLLPVLVLPAGLLVAFLTPAADLRRRAALVASTFVGLAFVHQVAVRSDVFHLTGCIPPVLLALVALPIPRRWLLLPPLLLVAVVTALASDPVLEHLRPGSKRLPPVARQVAGDELIVNRVVASLIDRVGAVFDEHVPREERTVFLAPTFPALYPILEKRSPTWGIYFLWPASEEGQGRILDDFEATKVRFLFIAEAAVDNRRELRFQNSHPLVWAEIQRRFERVPTPTLPPHYYLFRRREGS